jgi:hypothetical protein
MVDDDEEEDIWGGVGARFDWVGESVPFRADCGERQKKKMGSGMIRYEAILIHACICI